jgi:hypothetical protein
VALDTGTRAIVPVGNSWREVPARILDVSEGGVTLVMPRHLVTDLIEMELAGDLVIHIGMTLLVGLGYHPNCFWTPGEVLHCQDIGNDQVRVGVQFLTPDSLKLLGA